MANEITGSGLAGKYSYDYRLLAQSMVEALYPMNNLLQFLRRTSITSADTLAERFPKPPVLAAAALTDGTDMANTAYSPSTVTLTVGEVGLLLTLTDLARLSSMVEQARFGMDAGNAVAKKLTSDIAALGAGFSNTVGSTGVNLTEAQFLSARTTLQIADVPEPYYAVLYPQQLDDLIADTGATINALTTTGTSVRSESNDLANRSNFGQFHGVTLVTNSTVPTANAGADSAGHMAAAGRALAYVEKWNIRMETERDISLRANEIAVTACYAVGELDDTSGVGIVTDR